MSRSTWLKIINPMLALLVLLQAVTGFNAERIEGETFEALHVGGGLLLILLSIIHVVLNWEWIRANYFGSPRG